VILVVLPVNLMIMVMRLLLRVPRLLTKKFMALKAFSSILSSVFKKSLKGLEAAHLMLKSVAVWNAIK